MTPEELRRAWPEIEPKLQVGDIILTHTRKYNFVTSLVQSLTDSHWSHSALVFATGDMLPLGGTIIVEAFHPEGIRVHNMRKYTSRPDLYDIGVLRHRKISQEHRADFVKDFMASQIDIPYDTTRVVDYGITLLIARWFGIRKKVADIDPSRFICSTFAHRAVHAHETGEHPDQHAFSPADLVRSGEFDWVFNRQQ